MSGSTEESISHRPVNAGRILIIGGVSGTGKSTVGKMLANRLGWRFIEGDSFHSEINIAKMRESKPLSDDDRWPWLFSLRKEIKNYLNQGESAVMACSALKANYRKILRDNSEHVHFVFLTGNREILHRRLETRKEHFMHVELLASQLAALELSDDIILINSEQPVEIIIQTIMTWLSSLDDVD